MHGATGLLTSVVGLALAAALTAARADEVSVAVAANFAAPLARIAAGFSAATGHTLRPSTGSSGKLYSQIVAGAPFELLLAADDELPRQLVAAGRAISGSQFTYAIGHLVLWSAQPGLVDDQGAVLASARFGKLAIANPKLAPYGRAAMAVLKALDVDQVLSGRLVIAENVAQAYQFVATGNAELGFVALSQVAVPGKPIVGSVWHVPASLHGELRQDAVLLGPGAGKPGALALLAYLKSAPARAVIEAHGYGL
jgi:molybdate transport system substrate-binding protein